MIAMNFGNPDTSKTSRNLIVYLNYTLKAIIDWLEED